MNFEEWIELGYKLFGREAMKKFDKFTSGEIDFETCIDEVYEEYIKQKNTPPLSQLTSVMDVAIMTVVATLNSMTGPKPKKKILQSTVVVVAVEMDVSATDRMAMGAQTMKYYQ